MKTKYPNLYTDYLISTTGYATATELSPMLDGEMSHNQVTRFLSERKYTSRNWQEVKSVVRQIEQEEDYLIFDESVQRKPGQTRTRLFAGIMIIAKGGRSRSSAS
ncbi:MULTISPECIES: hypothetical protein [Nitrosomonas]|uniref:DDE superfamily endonuclease n=1 Tax=Nitrosomonas communis TaxID=44574 RepID=A0A5D3YBL0_9PROT|nr:hypothetical protein BCL69_105324 [Nitrosomonas communis]